MEEVIEIDDINALVEMITDIHDGVMLEVEIGEEDADYRIEGF